MKIVFLIIILLVLMISYGRWSFNKSAAGDIKALFQDLPSAQEELFRPEMIDTLPVPVQNWLKESGAIGQPIIRSLKLSQEGEMRLKPENTEWIKSHAVQYFRTDLPAFLWKVDLRMLPFLPVVGKDKYQAGKGHMLIKLFSLIDMVNEKGPKIDQGAAQRYLAEMCWFPTAAISPYLTWEAIDARSARATIKEGASSGTVVFYFSEKGAIQSIRADRFKENTPDAKLEKWVITPLEFSTVEGMTIPTKLEVTWALESGDFTWYRFQVSDLKYNFHGAQ